MGPVAPGNVGRLARFLISIRPLQTGEHPIRSILEAQKLHSALDVDAERGVTGTPDEAPLWNAWVGVATQLEQANRAAGISASCMAKRTP